MVPEWKHKPMFKTRSEFIVARKASEKPDISFDVDGDGFVGPQDMAVAKIFDVDHNQRFDEKELAARDKAIRNGYLDAYDFGHDQAGAKRPFPVRQVYE